MATRFATRALSWDETTTVRFQAGHIPSWQRPCERYALSPVAADGRWWLLLPSPLLSIAVDGARGVSWMRSGQQPFDPG